MQVNYNAEDGTFSFFAEVLAYEHIKPLTSYWGESAMHYICLFSYPGSVHFAIKDKVERDKSVISELKSRKLAKPITRPLAYPERLYADERYDAAEKQFLGLDLTPCISQAISLKDKIGRNEREIIEVEKKYKNDIDTLITLRTKLQKEQKELYADLREAEKEFGLLVKHVGIITPDMLMVKQ